MPAIKRHHTDTVDKPWDAAKNEKRLRSGENESYYHKCMLGKILTRILQQNQLQISTS